MALKVVSTLSILLCLTNISKAQDIPSISTDRPDQTEGSSTVPKGYFQIELGFGLENSNDQFDVTTYGIPSALFRYGIAKHLEARLIAEYITYKDLSAKGNGLPPVALGIKFTISGEKGILPELAILGHVAINDLATENFKANYYSPDLRLSMSHTLSEKFSLGYNLGAEWNAYSNKANGIYTLALGHSFNDKVSCYVEGFGFFYSKNNTHFADTGITYALNRDVQFDFSIGKGITKIDESYYIDFGFAARFK